MEKAERILAIRLLDRSWSDHLAAIEDIREGIRAPSTLDLWPWSVVHG
ncbi:MAG: hypothetical protein AB1714_17385 [Acidobacteriota bacterium]